MFWDTLKQPVLVEIFDLLKSTQKGLDKIEREFAKSIARDAREHASVAQAYGFKGSTGAKSGTVLRETVEIIKTWKDLKEKLVPKLEEKIASLEREAATLSEESYTRYRSE